VQATSIETLPFDPDRDVNLEVINNLGETKVRGGDVDEIRVEITRRGSGFTESRARSYRDDVQVDVRRIGSDHYLVEVKNDFSGFQLGWGSADLTITVPRRLNLDMTANIGKIEVRDVEIIDALYLEGNLGLVDFEGKIGPEGVHEIKSNVGEVKLRVTRDSNFRLDAQANVGDIEENWGSRFDETSQSDNAGSRSLEGVYGAENNPSATLRVQSNVGSIVLND
jgi:hypothetical protein